MTSSSSPTRKGVGLPTAEQELLLTAALGEAEAALSAWNQWRKNNDLTDMGDDARRLLPLIGHNMRQAGITLPEANTIAGVTRLGWAKSKLLYKTFGDVARLLQENGVDVLFIKGLPIALRHYPNPALRLMNDGDILVRPSQFERAAEILQKAGWSQVLEEEPSPAHHAVPFTRGNSQEIDVHRFALGECPFSEEDEKLWNTAMTIPFGGTAISIPDDTNILLMACVNSVHSPLRWVTDAAYLIRGGEVDWPRLIESARQRKVTLVTSVALSYVAQKYSLPVPEPVLAELQAVRVSWIEKREYAAWDNTDSQTARLIVRYASYRRIKGAQNPIGFLNHLRLYGNLNSIGEIPLWLLRGVLPKARLKASSESKK